jgi:uncharacterized membrane protein (UPF0127 family)
MTTQDAKTGYAFNTTRQAFLASQLRCADSHLSRLIGLMGTPPGALASGHGLWIVPCHGVHTFGMRYAIDLVYLNDKYEVVHTEENVKPWRVAAVCLEASTVLELSPHTIFQTSTCVGDKIEIRMGVDAASTGAANHPQGVAS